MKVWKPRKPKDAAYNSGASMVDHVKEDANAKKRDIEKAEKEFREAMEWEL